MCFRELTIDECIFENNQAYTQGDDLDLSGSSAEAFIKFQSTGFYKSSIYASFVNLNLQSLSLSNNIGDEYGAIQCRNCISFILDNSIFNNLNSGKGGALFLFQDSNNKETTSEHPQYIVRRKITNSS
jgi:hypothetical protein